MTFFSRVLEFSLNFLFPKSKKILALEALSAEDLLQTLPPAAPLKDTNILALFDYAHPLVKEMIWELKYGGNRVVAEKLGGILFDIIQGELEERTLFGKWGRPLLVPVPISGRRRFERGWNQAELLCEAIKKRDRANIIKYLPRQLIKIRHTESQTRTADKKERRQNLLNSMRVLSAPRVEGRCAVVVDDVVTTGSTFAEVKRALREAGAKKILFVAVAH